MFHAVGTHSHKIGVYSCLRELKSNPHRNKPKLASEEILEVKRYGRASLAPQLVKNLPIMQETWVGSLGWEDPLEKGKATYSSILAWRISWTSPCMGPRESDTTERLSVSRQTREHPC